MFLAGVGTTTPSLLPEKHNATQLSFAQPAKVWIKLSKVMDGLTQRDPFEVKFKHLFADSIAFVTSRSGSVKRIPVFVVIRLTETACRIVFGLQAGDNDPTSTWGFLQRF